MIALSTDPQTIWSHIIFLEYLIDPGCSLESVVACPSTFLKEEISMFWLLHKECIEAFAAITLIKIKKLQHSTPN
jgi:hypothetical protein